MPVKSGARLISKAIDENRREKVYLQFLAELPALKGGYTFEQYYKEVTRVVVKDKRPTEDIMEDIMNMKFD